jgi:hypothetical protein
LRRAKKLKIGSRRANKLKIGPRRANKFKNWAATGKQIKKLCGDGQTNSKIENSKIDWKSFPNGTKVTEKHKGLSLERKQTKITNPG